MRDGFAPQRDQQSEQGRGESAGRPPVYEHFPEEGIRSVRVFDFRIRRRERSL